MVSSGESCHKCLWWVVFGVILPNWNGDWFHPHSEYVVTNQYIYIYICMYIYICVGKLSRSHCSPSLESWFLWGNHPKMARHFRFVNYYYLPRYIYIYIYIYYSWNKVIFHGSVGVARPIPHDWGLFFWIIPLNVLLIGNDMVTNRGYMVITWWWYGE